MSLLETSMTPQIALTLLIVVLTLVAFIREWAPPDVLAMTILCLVVALGLVPMGDMSRVFMNEAPLTIAALFIIGGTLEKTGAVAQIGDILKRRLKGGTRGSILAFTLVAAFFSAWMNNTAIVAVLLPVTLGFARSKNIAASRLLLPLSYASILGGSCTLIGTSTNLLVNGQLKDLGVRSMTMFELAPVGIPLVIIGIAYMVVFAPKLIPARSSITGSLEIEFRNTPLHHLLITEGSPLIGMNFSESFLGKRDNGIHVLEVRRRGERLMVPLSEILVEKNDRFLVALHRRKGKAIKEDQLFLEIGAQELSTVDGIISELVVRDESALSGKSLAAADFRQRYNCVVLAVHRSGVNITKSISDMTLEGGDTLLVITATNNLEALKATRDFVLTDAPQSDTPTRTKPGSAKRMIMTWSVLAAVVLTATLTDTLSRMFGGFQAIPIHYAAIVGALILLWSKLITPREAYASIDWQVLLMLYGLLGLGMAMQLTGTAEWLARGLVDMTENLFSPEMLPYVMLWGVFLLTLCLTEVLSNNATAVMMIPIVVTLARELGVDPWPFIMGVTLAASAAFALPMGYQTHMMVFGPGGYKFTDFLRMGIPLNIICWIVSCSLIPLIWPF